MNSAQIHPTAVVHATAEIGAGVVIEPYVVVHANTVIGEGSHISSFAVIGPNTWIGKENRVHNHACLGVDPQDLAYGGEETFLVVGDRNRIREYVTINRGTSKGDGYTRVGSNNLLMACCHVAHDCVLGDHIIMANNVLLAGHVTVEDRAIINGAAGVQQFSTIGKLSYVGGLTRIVHDVAPFMVVEGNPSKTRKVNVVGLQRNGYGDEQISALKEAHRKIFRSRKPRTEVLATFEGADGITEEVAELCRFLRRMEHGNRGRSREV